MDKERKHQKWTIPVCFLLFSFALVFINLVPQNLTPARFAGPDLVMATSLAIVMRRPDLLPVWVIAVAVLMADFLLSRPLGLSAFVTVVASEIVRANRHSFLDMFFLMEWFIVGLLVVMAALAQQFLLSFVLMPGHAWGSVFAQALLTILCYPVMVMAGNIFFGIKRRTVHDGQKIGAL